MSLFAIAPIVMSSQKTEKGIALSGDSPTVSVTWFHHACKFLNIASENDKSTVVQFNGLLI